MERGEGIEKGEGWVEGKIKRNRRTCKREKRKVREGEEKKEKN